MARDIDGFISCSAAKDHPLDCLDRLGVEAGLFVYFALECVFWSLAWMDSSAGDSIGAIGVEWLADEEYLAAGTRQYENYLAAGVHIPTRCGKLV